MAANPKGKISRLPELLQQQLNARLFRGEAPKQILSWINREPAAVEMLGAHFSGSAFNAANLSQWIIGGYRDYLQKRIGEGQTSKASSRKMRRSGYRCSARVGKIARLPHDLRQKLNFRLLDGETQITTLAWLNELPEVKKAMLVRFGKPVLITPQNLSEWRKGGFEDWCERGGHA